MRILIVEDDIKLAENIGTILRRAAYAVDWAHDCREAEEKLGSDYDLVILDWKLPDGSGVDLCRRWRREELMMPVLMLTANSQLEDKVEGLDAGADDYLTKPFDLDELLARIRAITRRNMTAARPLMTVADLTIDMNLRKVWRNEKAVELSPREYALLEYLAMRAGQTVSRIELLGHVWDENVNLFSNTVDVHISYLRLKIDRGHKKKLITTVKGGGYALCGE